MTNQHLLTQRLVLISLCSFRKPPDDSDSHTHSGGDGKKKTSSDSIDPSLHQKRPEKGQQRWINVIEHSWSNSLMISEEIAL